MTKQNLTEIKSQLQKIAQEIETPTDPAINGINGNGNGAQSPEEVMELVDDAIEILEVAQEAIPAEAPEETPEVTPSIGARKRKAKKHGKSRRAADEDEDKDEDEEDKEKEAKIRRAQDQETSENDERQDEEDTAEEDIEKTELNARIRVLEGELDQQKKTVLAEEIASLYPDNVQQAKFDEIVNSKEKLATLRRDYKVAKEITEVSREAKSYTPLTSSSGGYLNNVRKASRNNSLPAWKV